MQDRPNYKQYSDFIGDEDFIKWHFTKDEDLTKFWNLFVQENPHLQRQFDEACSFLNKVSIKRESLDIDEKECLLLSIKDSQLRDRKRRSKRLYLLSALAAACVALVCIITLLNYNSDEGLTQNGAFVVEAIELAGEDIQIITSSGKTVLKNDANLQLQDDNTMLIQEKGGEDKLLQLDDTEQLNKIIVPFGKRTNMTLSDGTKIWLNSGSTLEFPTEFKGKTREVYLTGEVYADVAKSTNPFIVHSPKFDVKVYGTKLNIAAYANADNLILLESGSVGVKMGSKELLLKPREMAVLSDRGMTSQKNVNVEEFTSWKDGYLIFKESPMEDVLKSLGRYYNLSFQYEKENLATLEKRTCSGKIFLSENVDNVLTTFALLSGANYREENKKIIIDINPK